MDDDGDEVIGYGYRDILTNLLGVVCTIVIALAVLISVEKKTEKAGTPPPAVLEATIVWPDGNWDIDLWVFSPSEEKPIGFSNKTGAEWSLLRDDLGTINDSVPVNMENAFSRAVQPGRYYFNVHAYGGANPYPVTVTFELRLAGNGNSKVLVTTKVELARKGQEITVIQLDLDKNGEIVPGSVSNLFFPMFKAWP